MTDEEKDPYGIERRIEEAIQILVDLEKARPDGNPLFAYAIIFNILLRKLDERDDGVTKDDFARVRDSILKERRENRQSRH